MDNIIVSISGVSSNELSIQNGDTINLDISGVTPIELLVEGTPTVPTRLDQLNQSPEFRTVTDNQIEIWTGKQDNLGYVPEDVAKKNAVNGYAGLDANGFINSSALPTGSLKYKTSWNALTNTPELLQYDEAEVGNIYLVSESGVQWGISFQVGDWAVYGSDGYISDLPYAGNMVASVNGRAGAVILNKSDVGLSSTLDGAAVKSVNGVSGVVVFGLSGLVDDEYHRLVTDIEKLYWNSKSDNTSVVHLTGDENISGVKSFEEIVSDKITINNVEDGITKIVTGQIVHAYAGIDYLEPVGDGSQLSGITPNQIGLGKVTNDAQVKKSESSISGNIISWANSTGDTLDDTGISKSSVQDTINKVHVHNNKLLLDNIDQSLNSNSGVVFESVKSNNLSADRVLISGSDKKIESSYITKEELESLSGITGNIQNQLNSKQGNLSFGNIESGSTKLTISGQNSNAVIGSGITLDVSESNIIHNNLSGLTQGNPHTQYQLLSEKGQSSGYASLDGGGKVPLSQLPSTLLQYEGQWDASTNTPTLINPDTSKTSYVYEVSVAGNRFGFDWMIGDWLVYNASGQVERSINSNIVASVFGRTGAISAQVNDYSKSQISGLADTDNVTFNSEVLSNLTPNYVTYADTNRRIQSSLIDKTHLEYLSGVTSDIQSQIDSKLNVGSTTANINDSLNRRYVNDYQLEVIQNTSGVNSGDETYFSIESKLGISPVNVSALQSLSGINTGDETNASIKSKLGVSSSSNDGYLTQADWISFNDKISGVVTDNTLSGNGGASTPLKVEPSNISHNSLNNLQGGNSAERYHLANAQYVIATQTASSTLSGILSSTDWSTFNSKQNALTNPVTGTGVSGQIASFVGSTSVIGISATTASISPSINKQYVTDNQMSGIANAPNSITASNPVSDKKYTDDSVSGVAFWNRSSGTLSPKYVGDNVNLLSGGIKDNNSSGVIYLDDSSNTYPTTYNKTLVGSINELKNVTTITKDPTGFVDPTSVIVSYDSSTRKVTLTGSFKAYHRGVDLSFYDPTFVSGWVSPAHNNVTGYSYFLYYTGSTFAWTTSYPGFDYVLVCSIVYRTNDKFCIRECHGFMPWQTHEELHKTVGTYKDSGGDISNYTLNNTTAANRRPDISSCIVCDEDSHTTNAALTTKLYTQRYLSSASTANYNLDFSDIIPLSGNNPYYNQYTGSAWQQTLMPENSVASVWVHALPSGNDVNSQKYRFFFEQPQWITQAQNSSPSALASALSLELAHQISEVIPGEPTSISLEYVAIARIVIQYTGGNWTIQNVSYIIGSKYTQSSSSGNFLTSVSVNPTNLTGNGTVSSVLNTIQDISLSSSPTFNGITISGVTTLNSSLNGILKAVSGVVSSQTVQDLNSSLNHNSLSGLAVGDPHTQYILKSMSGVANGLATLNSSGVLNSSQVPNNINVTTLSGASLSTDGTFASNSDSLIPTQKATKTYSDSTAKSNAIKYALIFG